jgi:two-component system NtrC family sensor kinase
VPKDEQLAHLQRVLDLRNCALDAATAHFMITDVREPGSPIVYVNRAIAADHGYEPAELLGRSPSLLIARDLNPEQSVAINDSVSRGKPVRAELLSRRKDGTTFWAGISLEPVRDPAGQVTHYVSIGADITARREEALERRTLQERLMSEMQMREQMAVELRFAQKLEAVGQLAAGIAHEINTPVQYVGDSIHFLQSAVADLERLVSSYRTELDALPGGSVVDAARARLREAESHADLDFVSREVPKAFERAHEGIARVTAIVRAMKEFGYRDGHALAAADLNRAIETTLIVARNEYKYIAAVETRLAPLPEVMCSVGELNQVFLNLIVNAAHAIQQSGKDAATGCILITSAVEGDNVAIEFTDNGCGIAPANLEKIFDPFFTTKEVGKGTGQGLAITRSIVVDRHGGRIGVRSQPDVGSVFTLRLPIAGHSRSAPP